MWKLLFRLTGWKIRCNVKLPDKCVICVAPHTSNLDFILGILAYRSMGRKANFLMKSFWFFFPLKYVLKALGGIPVVRKGAHGSLTSSVIDSFDHSDYLNLAVTPEGTRSATSKWKTGFLVIAREAKVPIILAALNFPDKGIEFMEEYRPGPDIEKDMEEIKRFYSDKAAFARKPDQFRI